MSLDDPASFQVNPAAIVRALLLHPRFSPPLSAVREIVQNALDACHVRRELLVPGAPRDAYRPCVTVSFDEESRRLAVRDNGVGMTESVLRNHLVRIGSSYYASPEYAAQKLAFRPEDRWGIGFLSCFSIADVVRVETRSEREPEGHSLTIRRDTLSATWTQPAGNDAVGTEVSLVVDSARLVVKPTALVRFLERNFAPTDVEIRLSVRHTSEFRIGRAPPPDARIAENPLAEAIRRMRRDGDIQPFLAIARENLRGLSNRDLIGFDEKHLKLLLLTTFRNGGFYLVQSEVETDAGYIDILLTRKLQHAPFTAYEWLIELKYLKTRDRAKLAQTRVEGLEQLRRYAESELIRARGDEHLRKVLLTFVGKDEVYCDFLPEP